MERTSNTLTILMYPWFAMGHLIPYLLTANKLAERGHKIILLIPPKAQSKLGPLNRYPGLIELRPISIPHVQGLPPHIETTNDGATSQEEELLRQALDLTQPAVESILSDSRPDFVFFDFTHWLPASARRLRIKSVHYSVVSPASMSFLFAESPPSIEDLASGFPPSIKLYRHVADGLRYLATLKETGSGITVKQRLTAGIHDSDAVGFRTCREIEGDYIRFLENKLRKPILLAGPVSPKSETQTPDENWWGNWLNRFPPKSVIFCAFGSQSVLQTDQIHELLLGIELTGLPFLIALRPPSGTTDEALLLPDGFRERTGERGTVCGGWVPQMGILRHRSVGCFVTHCGYGSMWEGLLMSGWGCRLVALPHSADQYVHARLLSAVLRVAVEVEKGDGDGLFGREGVRGAVTAAMAAEGIGEEVRLNLEILRRVLKRDGFEDLCFDDFVGQLHALLRSN